MSVIIGQNKNFPVSKCMRGSSIINKSMGASYPGVEVASTHSTHHVQKINIFDSTPTNYLPNKMVQKIALTISISCDVIGATTILLKVKKWIFQNCCLKYIIVLALKARIQVCQI